MHPYVFGWEKEAGHVLKNFPAWAVQVAGPG
jgi:hypothetical protein